MKATGIVRRIDELGRVVIPKEIRRTLRIREGAPLEIFTEREGNIILKKYSPIGELTEYASHFADAIFKTLGKQCIICDKDVVIAASGVNKKEFAEKTVSRNFSDKIEERESFIINDKAKLIFITDGEESKEICSMAVSPIVSEGYTIGAVCIVSKKEGDMSFHEIKALDVTSNFLGTQMEQ